MTIHYIQPYALDGNISKAYNKAIKALPERDWVCITDQDAMFLLPDSKRQMYEIAEEGKHDLYGCMTNRLNVSEQVVSGMFDEMDLRQHYLMAKTLQAEYGTQCKPASLIAGLCMMFPVRTWLEVGGFPDLPLSINFAFDQYFSKLVKNKAIMQGVYMLHLYRLWSDDPRRDVQHLVR